MRSLFIIACLFPIVALRAQTLGGNAAYNFLRFSYAPQVSAAGGINISHTTADVSFAVQQPALLNAAVSHQLGVNFTEFSGLQAYQVAGSWHSLPKQTTFGASLIYLNYGSMQQTDAAGNSNGTFRATDYVLQLSAARRYLQRWQYGFSIKMIQSAYDQYRSAAVAMDAGLVYEDTARQFTIAVLAKNMGLQLKSYAGTKEDLPFDLQAGITKKLQKAPFAFSLTLQQMHRFDLVYQDTVFNQENNFTNDRSFFNQVFHHVVLATHIFIGRHLEATIGFNRLRRHELNIGAAGNGLTGFSAGLSARFEKFHVSYARSAYQNGIAFNQLGINLKMDRLFGMGAF